MMKIDKIIDKYLTEGLLSNIYSYIGSHFNKKQHPVEEPMSSRRYRAPIPNGPWVVSILLKDKLKNAKHPISMNRLGLHVLKSSY